MKIIKCQCCGYDSKISKSIHFDVCPKCKQNGLWYFDDVKSITIEADDKICAGVIDTEIPMNDQNESPVIENIQPVKKAGRPKKNA